MDISSKLNDFIGVFNRIINKYNALNQNAYDYGTGDLLHPSEIHMLTIIGERDGQNITDIARRLAVSKSAVSQIVQKLTRKGMARKYRDVENEKSIMVMLTAKGKDAVSGYAAFKKDIFGELIGEMASLGPEQVELIYSVLEKVDGHMDRKLEKYR
jgi:DNA-binding MarR family transcriptional regulator